MGAPQDVVELLQQLVRIPSVNPDGDPGTDQTGELALARYVGEFCQPLGAEVVFEEVEPDRPNVICRFPGGAGKPRLVFAPHLDTVSVAGMTIDPFAAEIRDGRVYGRGASDTKGSMATMLWTLFELEGRYESLPYEIWFAGLMGEEAGNDGARDLAGHLEADFVVVGEPTGMQVVHRHKGATWLKVRTSGVAGHGSNPRPDENAILRMARILPELRALSDRWAESPDPELGPSTLSIGTIQGGSKVNIVPDRCEVTIDMRVTDGQSRWTDELEAVLARHAEYAELVSSTGLPALNTPRENPHVQKLLATGTEPATAPWFCDAAMFAAVGIPAVAIGPGSIAQAHTRDEWIAIDELLRGTEFFRAFLLNQSDI